jgi:hypothetical protein
VSDAPDTPYLIRVSVSTGPIRVTIAENEAVRVGVLSLPVTVRVAGQPGPQGPAGPAGQDSAGWTYYATRWSLPPAAAGVATVSSAAGTVTTYQLDGVTRWRFVPDDYDAALDAFYSAFSGGVLSGLIVARGA